MAVAREVVRRWRRFCRLEPYTSDASFAALLLFAAVTTLFLAEAIRLEAPVAAPAAWRAVEAFLGWCLLPLS